jgi:hypothetical protein
VKAYFDALAREDIHGAWALVCAMSALDRLRVMLCMGIGAPSVFGFGAEVGRA